MSTAVATVRQAVALVFEHISLESSEQQASSLAIPDAAEDVAHLDPGSAATSDQTHAAALQLLGDLCAMSSGVIRCRVDPTQCFISYHKTELKHFCVGCRGAAYMATIPCFVEAICAGASRLCLECECGCFQNSPCI